MVWEGNIGGVCRWGKRAHYNSLPIDEFICLEELLGCQIHLALKIKAN